MMTKSYVNVKNAISSVKERISDKKGMEMLQMVIILGIAVALGVAFYALMDGQFDSFSTQFKDRLSTMFTDVT